jgi:hypothetical protein
MADVFDKTVFKSKLLDYLGDYDPNHVGYVYAIDFETALVLTNDHWKARVAGIPHNSFLVATAFNPENPDATPSAFDHEVVLLRVQGPANLPSDGEMVRTRIEHNQRREPKDRFAADDNDGFDPMTQAELQYGGLECRILGTFFLDNDGTVKLGSDVENFFASTRLRVYKPRGAALEKIVNHINEDRRQTMEKDAKAAGFKKAPSPIKIGTVRYTSTSRLHRGKDEPEVPVYISPSDFLARRTAVLGMTRTGKSNTVKTTVASVAMAAKRDGIKVGQIIFDINGEYSNANHQDDGSSIAEVFGNDCVRYRAVDTPGFEDLRANFYDQCAEGLNILGRLLANNPYPQTDLDQFIGSGLEQPDPTDYSAMKRWERRKAVFQCILFAAGYPAPPNFVVRFSASEDVIKAVSAAGGPAPNPVGKGVYTLPIAKASDWFVALRGANYVVRDQQKKNNEAPKGLVSSSSGEPWVDAMLESYLNVLALSNATGTGIRGWRALVPFKAYHSPLRQREVVTEIVAHLRAGKIVILDLSAGPVEVRTVLSKRIAQQIFDDSFTTYNSGKMPQNIAIYVEEAHNLIGKKEELTSTWPRIAKEGAKAKIAFVYATQEPSSIHPNILANTENWFVTHLNNDDELKALGKFYDFADFAASLKHAQDVGFARIKTLSSPFVVPTQIDRFTPAALKEEIAKLAPSGSSPKLL